MQNNTFKFAQPGAILLVLFFIGSGLIQLRGGETLDWSAHATSLENRIGERFTFTCPPNGTLSTRVWGTDLYTHDSSICSAAVHAGVITVARGGTVTIEMRPGAPSYQGNTRNGVLSRSYGAWNGSFVFVAGKGHEGEEQSPPCSNKWFELRPGTLSPGPIVKPGLHKIWLGKKDPRTGTITRWDSFGPFQVNAGTKYLVSTW
jgi:hypothetical protein